MVMTLCYARRLFLFRHTWMYLSLACRKQGGVTAVAAAGGAGSIVLCAAAGGGGAAAAAAALFFLRLPKTPIASALAWLCWRTLCMVCGRGVVGFLVMWIESTQPQQRSASKKLATHHMVRRTRGGSLVAIA